MPYYFSLENVRNAKHSAKLFYAKSTLIVLSEYMDHLKHEIQAIELIKDRSQINRLKVLRNTITDLTAQHDALISMINTNVSPDTEDDILVQSCDDTYDFVEETISLLRSKS